MNKKIVAILFLVAFFVAPCIGMAALDTPSQPTQGAISPTVLVNAIASVMWLVFIAVVIIYFVIIGILFLSNLGNPEEIAKARRALIWGGVGVGVGVFAFGIVRIVMNTTGI